MEVAYRAPFSFPHSGVREDVMASTSDRANTQFCAPPDFFLIEYSKADE